MPGAPKLKVAVFTRLPGRSHRIRTRARRPQTRSCRMTLGILRRQEVNPEGGSFDTALARGSHGWGLVTTLLGAAGSANRILSRRGRATLKRRCVSGSVIAAADREGRAMSTVAIRKPL